MQLSVLVRERVAQDYLAAVEAALAPLPEAGGDFAGLEAALEAALRRAGGQTFTTVLAALGTGFVGKQRPCACGGVQKTDHYLTCSPQTVLGAVTVRRAAYHCGRCGRTDCPLDAQVALPAEQASPLLRARLSLCCALEPFVPAVELLAELTGLEVSAKQAQLVSEALGTQVAADPAQAPPAEPRSDPPPARLYLGVDGVLYCSNERGPDGALRWREAKVGVFYTPKRPGAPGTGRRSRLAPTGPPVDVADPDEHSYVVHLGSWQEFAQKVWQEGQRRGLAGALQIVVLSDGAVWIQSLIAEILAALPGQVIHILDLYHAEEHLWAVGRACLGDQVLAWIQTPLDHLRQGRVEALVAALRALAPPTPEAAHLITTTAAYYAERRAQMDYPAFRAQGMHVGSGLAESACKRLVAQRAKGPGMHWSVVGAQAILTLRAARLSNRWHEVIARAQAG